MKRYRVIFEESVQENIRDSYNWGCRVWGKPAAQQWVRELRRSAVNHLAVFPKGFPVAPENDEFVEEIRQMIVARYRILFTIKAREGHVLHVRGAYVGPIKPSADDA